MRIFRHISNLPDEVRGATVTIGNFDGVHRGHAVVIGRAREIAAGLETPLTVVTFEPHPRRFFRPDDAPFQLTPLRSKARRIAALGADALQLLHFDGELAGVAPEEFVDRIVVDGLGARHVVVGYDFVFGKARAGDVGLLETLAAERGFGVTVVAPVKAEGGPVYSSTNIRAYLAQGAPADAAGLLGRCWEIEGRVRTGDRRGRQIGFPTANLAIDDYIEPALGVYAVWAGIDEGGHTDWHMGCANIGHRPTFDGTGVTVETHILDFSADIYDQHMRVALVDFLRPERKFDGVDSLRAQIGEDCTAARALLGAIGEGDLRSPPDRGYPADAIVAEVSP